MKIRIQMKDPDTLHDAIADAVHADTESISDEDERIAVKEVRTDKANKVARKWFRYGEYLTVELDTEDGSCIVVPNQG
jgi:hypothetical protein